MDLMNHVDRFFNRIVNIRKKLDSFEKIFLHNRRWISRFSILCVVLSVVLFAMKQETVGVIVFLGGMFFFLLDGVIKWRHSVRQWLKVGLAYNSIFTFCMAVLLQPRFNKSIIMPVFLILFSLIWILMSLISDSNVSLLVNEVISGMSTTIFTIVTYVLSIKMEELSKIIGKDFTQEYFERAIINGNYEYLLFSGLETLKYCFIILLPIIGVTAISIVLIKIEVYWEEKRESERTFDE